MLQLTGVTKRFGRTLALNSLDLAARPGEVVGVVGPNGAGKSTLIHILAGEVREDSGTVELDGQRLEAADRPALVSIVHQELQLFPTLTVLENILIGSENNRLTRPRPTPRVRSVAAEFGLSEVADKPLDACSLVVNQLTEIARAIVHRKRIVLLDEPNSALTDSESERLFREVLRIRDEGSTIILLVSHRLSDLQRFCDRAMVIRDGVVAAEFAGPELTSENIAQAIVGAAAGPRGEAGSGGRAAKPPPRGRSPRPGERQPDQTLRPAEARTDECERIVVDVRGWTDQQGEAFSKVDLTVHAGEAVFITGQEDGGGREILRSIARLRAAKGDAARRPTVSSGTVRYVPGSRASSLFPNLSVQDNLCVRLDSRVIGGRGQLLRRGRMTDLASAFVKSLAIRTPGLGAPIGALSGGNQQKVAIGSALASQPGFLIVEEPTRGVDVQTRQDLVSALRSFLEGGGAILGFSPDLHEVFELADSVRVAVKGRLSAPLRLTSDTTLEGLARWVDMMNQGLPENRDASGNRRDAIEQDGPIKGRRTPRSSAGHQEATRDL
ncbi:MAG: ATP-binding cassette domain-containing protein [Acetobacteraceae bacterium]